MKNYIKANETSDGILLKYRENDKVIYKEINFNNYFYILEENFDELKYLLNKYCYKATLYKAINGNFVKLYLNDNLQRNSLKRLIEDRGIKTFEADINAVKRFLIDNYQDFEFGNVKILWYDIETDDRGEFEKDNNGYVIAKDKQILSIAMLDENNNVYFFYNKHPDDKTLKSEYELFKEFFNVFKNYDLVTAWNADYFDHPYIEQRLKALETAGYDVQEFNKIWSMLIHLDELQKYKNLDYNKHDSYSLESVANDELSDGKIDFSDEVPKGRGKFYKLFKNNLEKFKEYNVKDVKLMKDIDAKRGHFKIAKHLSNYTKTPIESFMYNSHILDLILLRNFKQKFRVCKSKPTKQELIEREKQTIGGGYTFCYNTGLFKNVEVFDFKSHYPLVMITFNISDETFVKYEYPDIYEVKDYFNEKEFEFLEKVLLRDLNKLKIANKKLEKFIKDNNLNTTDIMLKFIDKYKGLKFIQYAKENNLILTPADLNLDTNGWHFHPHRFYIKERGELSKLVKDAVQERDKIKYKLWSMKKEKPDIVETQEYKRLDSEQHVLKTLANSAYGFTGLRISRFFEWNVADAITTCARWITKKTIIFSKRLGYSIIGGDTDSIFLKNIESKYNIQETNLEYYSYYKNVLFNDFNLKDFNNIVFKNPISGKEESHHFFCVFEHEKSYDSMIMVAKKRYYFLQYGKVQTQGGAFKKLNTNSLAKKLQKELCEDLLNYKFDKNKWYKKIKYYKDLCFNYKLDPEYLEFRVQYNSHWSNYGGVMTDKNGNQVKTKDGKIREKVVPAYIELAKRLELEGKPIEVGDTIIYIIGDPKTIDLMPVSRKKKDRELFFELKNKFKDLNILKQELEKRGILYKEIKESRQRAITVDEYLVGEKYNAQVYWERITTPLIEILQVYDKELCFKEYKDLW